MYPYLVHSFDEYFFSKFDLLPNEIEIIANNLYDIGINKKIYEPCSFALFWSLKFNCVVNKDYVQNAIDSNDCIFMLLSYVYEKKIIIKRLLEN